MFSLFAGSYVFDFRSEEPGGHWMQFVFLGVSVVSYVALFLALLVRRARPEVYSLGWIALALALLLPTHAFLGAIYNSVDIGNFARLEIRYVFFFQSVTLIYLLGRAGIAFEPIMKVVLVASAIAVVWSNFHALNVQDLHVAEARHRLAPLVIMCILGIGAASVYAGKLLYLFPLLFALYFIQLSSTRSFLVGVAGVYAMMHLYALAGREKRKLIGMAVFDGILVAALLYLWSRGVFDNWVERFVLNRTGGGDATLLTRLAEFQSQWNYLSANWRNAIFGAGLGSEYGRDLGVMRLAILSRHVDLDEVLTFEFGHSLWVYSAFYGGLLGGWILPLIFVSTFFRSASNAFRSHRNGNRRRYLIDLQCNAIVVQAMLVGFFAHPFSLRLFAILFGLVFAITFIYPRDEETNAAARRRRARGRRMSRAAGAVT